MVERDPPHWRFYDGPTCKMQLQWEPRDLWVGLFWRRSDIAWHIYVCLLPCVPVHITRLRGEALRGQRVGDSD